jgi:hypothetical protein
MKRKSSLIGGAALGAIVALGMGATAEAKAPPRNSQAAQIEALRLQVQALTERLNAQEAAQQQAQAATQQAQATAQQAQARAEQAQMAADAQIKTIPAQVETALAAVPKPKPSWASDTTVGGRVFADISNIDQKSDGVGQPNNGFNFDIKRFYVSVDHKFNDVWSADLTADASYVAADKQTQLYIKKAYLQAKFSDALTLRMGAADLPWIPFVEDLYGYRYVENVLVDRTKFGTSTDWGLHASGKLADGLINYAVSAVNGNGYKNPSRSQGIDLEGRVNVNYDHFVVGVGGYTGKLGKDVQGVTTFHTANRFDAVAAFKTDKIRLGAEYFHASDWSNVLSPTSDSSEGYGLFASYKFTPKVSVFGRYDWVKPNKDTAPTVRDHYVNLGVSYSPLDNIDLALVYKRDKADNGFISTSNGTIGGVTDGTYDEIGLFTQYRW